MVEGKKSIKELIDTNYKVDTLLFENHSETDLVNKLKPNQVITECGKELKKISSLENPPDSIAIVAIPNVSEDIEENKDGIVFFLDDLQDPGNLGTIIRTAVWYGFKSIILSKGTTDVFNPKTIQACMGAFAKIKFAYADKEQWMQKAKNANYTIIGTYMEGEGIHDFVFPNKCVIVLGNEGKGISPAIEKYMDHRITIPGTQAVESLNAAIAAGIVMDNVVRRKGKG